MSRAVHRHSLCYRCSRRRCHVNCGYSQLLKGYGYNCRGGGRSHISKGHYCRCGFLLCQHCRILIKLLLVLPSDCLGVLHKVCYPQLCQMLLNPVKHCIVVAEAKLCVVVKQHFPLLQLLYTRPLCQLYYRPLLFSSRIQYSVYIHFPSSPIKFL